MATNPAGKGTKTIGINMKMEMAKELEEAKAQARVGGALASLSNARSVGGFKVGAVRLDGIPGKELRALGERLLMKYNDGYVAEEGQDPERGYPGSWLHEVIRARPDQFRLEQESEAETELPY